MPILSAQHLARSYGTREVLKDVSIAIEAGEHVGLVGRNGTGKSTLSRILAGIEDPDAGEVIRSRDLRLAYLEQEPKLPPEQSAIEVVLGGLEDWSKAMTLYEEVSSKLANDPPSDQLDTLLQQQAECASRIEDLGGWDRSHQAASMLEHLAVFDHQRPVGQMSGGEQRRVAMARLLVSQPDLAIVDEPTNHLDLATIEWLERYLVENYRGALILITHDRYLLNTVVTRTWELESGTVYSYDGGWEKYLSAKAEREAHEERVESNRQNFLRRELEWVRRQPKARTTKSKSRLERFEEQASKQAPKQERSTEFGISQTRSGRTILECENLKFDRNGVTLIEDLTLHLNKNDRIGIFGPNGCGKTTLLRCLLGELEPTGGRVTLGKNTKVAYLDQLRGGLDPEDTVYDAVSEGRVKIQFGGKEVAIRSYLERFLFEGHRQIQKVGSLSGGERARVALAKILRDDSNLVVLDEPTNDLDVTTLSALESALLEYQGAALIVTHDRWFLDRIASSVLACEQNLDDEVVGNRWVHRIGNYSSYRAEFLQRKRESELEKENSKPAVEARKTKKSTDATKDKADKQAEKTQKAREKKLKKLLKDIEDQEEQLSKLETEASQSDFYERSQEEQKSTFGRIEETRSKIESLTEEWETLESES